MKRAANRTAILAGLLTAAIACTARADLVGHGAPVRDIVISADASQAITSAFDDTMILWDLETQSKLLTFVGHGAAVNAAAFLTGRIASVSDDGTLRLWDRKTAKLLRTIAAHDKKVVTVAVSPDGSKIATGSWDRTAKVWDAETGALIRTFDRHQGGVNTVLFAPSGAQVYSAGYDGAIWLWWVDSALAPRRLADKGFPFNDMTITGNGKTLVTGSSDGIVRIWDAESGALEKTLKGHEGSVLAVAVTSDGSEIASGSTDGFILIWEGGEAPKQKLPVQYYRAVWSISFTPDGQYLYAAGVDSVARGWRVEDGAPISGESTPFQPIDRVPEELAFSDDPIERGAFHFRKCAVCHTLTDDGTRKSGPSLQGIFDRKVGTYPGYLYSDALAASDIVWNEDTISRLFEIGPEALLPGTKMPLQELPDPEDRAALIAYLKAKTIPTAAKVDE